HHGVITSSLTRGLSGLGERARAEEAATGEAPDVGVEHGGVTIVSEREDRARGVPADPWQASQRRRVVGQVPAVTGDGLARDRVQAHGTDVVAERVPEPPDVLDARPGQVVDRRVAPEELAVFRDDAIYLRLLEHDLGDEDAVGMARAPPGKIA